jgi:hypothetical protein
VVSVFGDYRTDRMYVVGLPGSFMPCSPPPLSKLFDIFNETFPSPHVGAKWPRTSQPHAMFRQSVFKTVINYTEKPAIAQPIPPPIAPATRAIDVLRGGARFAHLTAAQNESLKWHADWLWEHREGVLTFTLPALPLHVAYYDEVHVYYAPYTSGASKGCCRLVHAVRF